MANMFFENATSNDLEQQQFEQRSLQNDQLSSIRENAQKQFNLGYQEPEPNDGMTDGRLNTDEANYQQEEQLARSPGPGAQAAESPQKADSDDHIKITIELGEGLSEDIIVPAGMENCAPELSKQFCKKHGFEDVVMLALTEKISENIEKIKEERRLKTEGRSGAKLRQSTQTNKASEEEVGATAGGHGSPSPEKDIQAEASYGNLYQQPPVDSFYRNKIYDSRPGSVNRDEIGGGNANEGTQSGRHRQIIPEARQQQQEQLIDNQLPNSNGNTIKDPKAPEAIHCQQNSLLANFTQFSRTTLNDLQQLQFNPITLGADGQMGEQIQNGKERSDDLDQNEAPQLEDESPSLVVGQPEMVTNVVQTSNQPSNRSNVNNHKAMQQIMNDHSSNSRGNTPEVVQFPYHDVNERDECDGQINNLILKSNIPDSQVCSPGFLSQNPRTLLNSNFQNKQYMSSTGLSRIEQKYLNEDQGSQSPTDPTNTRKNMITESRGLTELPSQEKSPAPTDTRRGRSILNSQQQSDMKKIDDGYRSRYGAGGIYEEILAQSEYGYVAKMGRWKEAMTKKTEAETIQRKSVSRSAKSHDARLAGSKANAAQGGADLRSKPYVNQISQLLAKTSNKRKMPEEDKSTQRKASIHDRLFQQATKGKVMAQLLEQEEAKRQQKKLAKSGRLKNKKQLSQFLVSSRDRQSSRNRHLNQKQMNQMNNLDSTHAKNQSMQMEGLSNRAVAMKPYHQKSKSHFLFKTVSPADAQRPSNTDSQAFNNQPVSIEFHTDLSGNLNTSQPREQKFQTIQVQPNENQERFDYRTPAYRQNNLSTAGGRSEVVQLLASGIEERNQRQDNTSSIKDVQEVQSRGLSQNLNYSSNQDQQAHQQHFGDEDTCPPESENFSVRVGDLTSCENAMEPRAAQQPGYASVGKKVLRRNESPTGYQNIGDKLYKKGMQRNIQRQQFLNGMSKLKEAQELRDATFQPTITNTLQTRQMKSQEALTFGELQQVTFDSNQQKMVIREGQPVFIDSNQKPKMDRQNQENLGRRLMQYGEQLQLKKAAAKQFHDQQETQNLEFKPKINRKSVEIVNQRNNQRRMQYQSMQFLDKKYGNSHLKSKQQNNQCDQSQNYSQVDDSPLKSLKFTPQIEEKQDRNNYFMQNEVGTVPSRMRKSEENLLMSRQTNCFSPQMSLIQNEVQIPEVKSPANFKMLNNFQSSPILAEAGTISHNNDDTDLMSFEQYKMSMKTSENMNLSKHEALYFDAKYRSQRQREIYAKCIDKECTFKPDMITKKSNLSKKVVKEVQEEVNDRLHPKFNGTSDPGSLSTKNFNHTTQRKDTQTSRQALQRFNENMHGYTQNESVLGAPIREVIPYNETSMTNLQEPLTYTDLFRQKSLDKNLRFTGQSLIEERNGLGCKTEQLSPQPSNSRIVYLNRADPNTKFTQPVFKRLSEQAQLHQEFQRELRKQRQHSASSRDPVTGQRYFKPIIKRHQSQGRRNQPHQVGQNLYSNYSQTQEKIQSKRDEELHKLQQQRRQFARANSKSDRMINNARKTKLGEIFDRIDHDGDGEITSNNIDLSNLPDNLVRIFKPLFTELQILMQPLDKEEFIDAGMRLYDSLSQNEKNIILKFDKKNDKIDHELEKCTFAPQTNVSNVGHKVNDKLTRPPLGSRLGSHMHSHRQSKKLQKYLTKAAPNGTGSGYNSTQQSLGQKSSVAVDYRNQYVSFPEQSLREYLVPHNRQSSRQRQLANNASQPPDAAPAGSKSKAQTPGRSPNQSSSRLLNQQQTLPTRQQSSLVLNDQLTDKSLMQSVHQKLCDLQNQSKQSSSLLSVVPPSNGHLTSQSNSIQSQKQQQLLAVPQEPEQPYNPPKQGSSLSIMDIGPKIQSNNQSHHISSRHSQGSEQSIPKPFGQSRVPNMQVQPPAIIKDPTTDSGNRLSLISELIPEGSRQHNQLDAIQQSPFKIHPQQTQPGSSNEAHDNITQISHISQQSTNPKHLKSSDREISPVKELEDLEFENLVANQQEQRQIQSSIVNPYISSMHRRASLANRIQQAENELQHSLYNTSGGPDPQLRKQQVGGLSGGSGQQMEQS